jgi:hypothetical protein
VRAATPHALRLIRKGFPYSPGAVDLYRRIYRAYLERDSLTSLHVADVEEHDASEIFARPFPVTRWFKITEWN